MWMTWKELPRGIGVKRDGGSGGSTAGYSVRLEESLSIVGHLKARLHDGEAPEVEV